MSITTLISSLIFGLTATISDTINGISLLYVKSILFILIKNIAISCGVFFGSAGVLLTANSIFDFGMNIIAVLLYSFVVLLCFIISISQSFYFLLTMSIISGIGLCIMILISETFESVTGTPSPMSPTRSSRRDNTAATIIFCLISIFGLTGFCLYKETNRLSKLIFTLPSEVVQTKPKKPKNRPLRELKVFDAQQASKKPIKLNLLSEKKKNLTPKRRKIQTKAYAKS